MRALVTFPLTGESARIFLTEHVLYRPGLAEDPLPAGVPDAELPDVVLVRHGQSGLIALSARAWPSVPIVVCGLSGAEFLDDLPRHPGGCFAVSARNWALAEYEAFMVAENLQRPRPAPLPTRSDGPRDAILVGAGIVNLVTALALVNRGWSVKVFDRLADPTVHHNQPPARGGATFGGKDARIFSFNESRHHLARSPAIAPDGVTQFRQSIGRDGWLSVAAERMGETDWAWIRQLEGVPPWAAMAYGNDIIRFNIESHGAWREMFGLHPELLQGVGYIGRLLRVYQTEASFQAATRSEAELGALIEVVDLERLASAEPALAGAIRGDAVAGALKVQGFSLGIKSFARNLVRLLASKGVAFHWNHELEAISYGDDGSVTGVTINGTSHIANNYVVSLGAYGREIRGGGRALGQIGAMVGMWVTIPNDVDPLSSPLKVRRRGFGSTEAAEGANIIPGVDDVGNPVLHCSSGHGFLGVHPRNVDLADLPELARCVRETAEDLFGDKLARAGKSGLSGGEPEFCVRPWTPSGLGILDFHPTRDGGALVVSGGHNTGGFAQSPAVADAVVSTLEGRSHPMQTLYHPERYRAVFAAPTCRSASRQPPCRATLSASTSSR